MPMPIIIIISNVDKLARIDAVGCQCAPPGWRFSPQTFAMWSEMADRQTRRDGAEMIRLIDASPIPLGKVCKWAKWNGRIRGMKMHVVYDPGGDCPRCVEITPATVNDVEIGRNVKIEAGATYVFDKGYYRFGWWRKINDTKAFFVTRTKTNTRFRATGAATCAKRSATASGSSTMPRSCLPAKAIPGLPIPLRRIRIRRDTGGTIALITNDLERTAVEIAAL